MHPKPIGAPGDTTQCGHVAHQLVTLDRRGHFSRVHPEHRYLDQLDARRTRPSGPRATRHEAKIRLLVPHLVPHEQPSGSCTPHSCWSGVEPEVGIEPTTYRLQGGCSTTELHRPTHTLLAREPQTRRSSGTGRPDGATYPRPSSVKTWVHGDMRRSRRRHRSGTTQSQARNGPCAVSSADDPPGPGTPTDSATKEHPEHRSLSISWMAKIRQNAPEPLRTSFRPAPGPSGGIRAVRPECRPQLRYR